MKNITVKVQSQIETVTEHKVMTQNSEPIVIAATNNINYELIDDSTGHAPDHIITKRVDKDLHVSFENNSLEPGLIIEGFYEDINSALIGLAEDGSYYYYIPDSGEVADYVTELEIGDVQGQALGGTPQAAPWWVGATEVEGFDALPWLAGLAGVGILGAALGSSGGSSNNNQPPIDNVAPDAPTDVIVSPDGSSVTGKGEVGSNVEITDSNGDVIGEGVVDENGNFDVDLVPPQVDGEEIDVTLTDEAGNTSDPTNALAPDTTAPDAPTDVIVSEDGSSVTGKGEAGNKVEITDSNGDVIGEGVVDENGSFDIDLVPPQVDGEEIDVTLTDEAGNTSDPTSSIAPDLTVPDAPTDVIVSEDGSTVTGKGEAGTKVEITDPNGDVIGEGMVDENGSFDIDIVPPQVDSEEIEVTLTDEAGNTSDPTSAIAPDLTAPNAPTSIVVGNDDGFLNEEEVDADNNVDAVIGLPDDAKVGDTVIVNDQEQTLTPDDITANEVTVKIPAPAEGELLDITATIKDAAGNESQPLNKNVGVVDIEAPGEQDGATQVAPVIAIPEADNGVNADEIADGIQTQITLPTGTLAGDSITLTVTPTGGSTLVEITHTVTGPEVGSGVSEVTIPNDINGISADGDYSIVATVTDQAGNSSAPSASLDFSVDTEAPSAPSIDSVNENGVAGSVTAGEGAQTVEITLTPRDEADLPEGATDNGDGTFTITVPVAADGSFSTDITPQYGTDVRAEAVDAAGNHSMPTTETRVDTTAPDSSSTQIAIDEVTADNVINSDEAAGNVTITGTVTGDFTEDDSVTVTVNNVTSAGTVNADGTFSVAVAGSDLAADTNVSVSIEATDAAGNVGTVNQNKTYNVDTEAPDAPTDVIVSPDGSSVTGKGEAGSSVEITDPNGDVIGEGMVDENGNFDVDIVPPQVDGEEIDVTLTDEAGNTSDPTNALAPDLTAPDAPTSITVGNDDSFLNEEEIDADGNIDAIIGLPDNAVAGDTVIVNGQEQILTPDDITNKEVTVKVPAPAEGESLDITATIKDAAGNESQPLNKNVGVVDTIAPNAPTNDFTITDNVANDGSGDVLDPPEIIPAGGVTNDNTPSITIPAGTLGADETAQLIIDGEVVEATIVDNADGSLTLTPNNALTDGAHDLSYNLKDAAGNVSSSGPVVNITVDTTAPGEQDGATQVAPVIAIPEAEDGVNADEIADGIQTEVTLPTGTLEGDTITLTVTPADGTPIQITHVVTGPEVANGVSEITIPNDINGIIEDGDYSIVATVTDLAGNSSAPSDFFDFTVDTVAELTVDIPIAGDNVINADEAAEGFNVTGTGTAGDTITLTNQADDLIGTAVVGANGKWSISVTQQNVADMNQGLEALKITATDPAGNVNSETANITIVPATALTITTPIAGDNLVNADEAVTGFDVTGTGAAGDTITLTNQTGDLIGTIVVGSDNRWSIAVESAQVAAMGEGLETLIATSGSDTASATITIDTAVPDDTTTDIVVDDVTADNVINAIEAEGNIAVTGSVTGDYSEGDALTITVNGIEYAGAVDFAGSFSVEVPGTELVADADNTIEVSISATDQAGNTGIVTTTKDYAVNTDEIIAAADNFVDLQLNATPLEIVNDTPSDLNKTGFTVVGASLGPVLGAGVVADVVDNSVVLEVGEDQVREVTVKGNAGGVQVAGTMNLNLYKLNESTGEWELQAVKENWVVSYLLGGVSEPADFSLDEGQWLFVMSGNEGISALTGYTLQFEKDVVLDYSEATAVSGSVTGDLLADDDASFSYDELPSGTTVTSITSSTGTQTLESGETTIQGQYGTLTIASDGSYEYSVNEDFRGPYGSEERFTYTIASPDGNTDSADLTIELNILPADKQVKIDEVLVVDAEPTVILDTPDSEIKDAVGFGVLDLSFGSSSVLDLELLGGKPPLEFSVGDNQVRELTLHGSAGGVEIAKTYSMAVYKLNEDTGQYEQVHFEKNWFNAPLLGGRSDPLTLQFGEGDYKAVLLTAGGVGVLSGNGLYVDHDTIYDYDQPSKFTGEITGDATPDVGTVILKVGEEAVTSNAPMTYQGKYGQLVIDANGEYTYSVNNNASDPNWQPPYGEVDSFRLVTKDANGNAAVETLNIKISTHTAVDDFNEVAVQTQNTVTNINFNEPDKIGNYGKSYTKEFEIAEHDAAAPVIIEATARSTNIAFGDNVTITYTLLNTTTGQSFVGSVEGTKAGASLSDSLPDLPAGNYELTITTNKGNLQSIGFDTTVIHSADYTASDVMAISGSLIAGNDNDQGIDNITELKVDSKSVFISDPNQGAQSIDIEGLYGTLTVSKDGSYSYLPNGESFGIERFTYETNSVTGVKETATLEINVGKNITASIYDDVAISSAANDSFIMGEGADTLVFGNLGTENGGNGNNGLDTWNDFSAAQGDTIDVTGLLDGNQTAANIGDYLTYENGVLMVDRNGNAEFEGLLEVTATDLNELLGSIEWEVGAAGIAEFSLDALDGLSSTRSTDAGEGSKAMMMDSETSIGLSDIFENETIEVQSMSVNTEGSAVGSLQGSQQSATDNQAALYDAWQVNNYPVLQNDIGADIQNII
ncbi:BapA/Bap/LapF family large adhesin [Psychrobacter halodurans]|uniref:Ig-like domain-containing protein n=1 Tax=Psychrobacter halodurans TaxID=2818439 RepID=A0AAW4IR08_9GAMM|nr:BapA/Bap/LapF family large adhesin [Psychrobacter halodurans]MBO1517809.1 Ig-like domain-containing protein [Psychrobacter halodurans]